MYHDVYVAVYYRDIIAIFIHDNTKKDDDAEAEKAVVLR